MKFTLQTIAQLVGGTVEGNPDLEVWQLAKIDEPSNEGSIGFFANPKYEPYVYTTNVTALLIAKDFVPKKEISATLIRVDNPYTAFTVLLETYSQMMQQQQLQAKKGIEQPSFVGEGVQQGQNVYVGAFAYVGKGVSLGNNVKIFPHSYIGDNVQLGDDTIVYAGAKIYENTVVGKQCTIHAGAVVGSEGFGFSPQADGTYRNIPQLGRVILEDNVSIGANTTIDRATIGETIISEGTKLDNLIQIGHNVVIGKHTVIAAQTGIAGSTKVGDYVMIGGQVGIAGHTHIPNKTKIGAQAGVGNIPQVEGQTLLGSPAFDVKQYTKSHVVFKQLPQLLKRIEALEKKNN
jgi:UDP-3-O-[3-hydroxymyristoyl] glucosamine N-acyltransferase